MRDSVNSLFRQRFQGHESPVDPAVWQGIQQQLAQVAPTPDGDGVSKLFKERFQGHETPVDPAVWANISTQLGHSVVAGTSAATGWLGWAAAGAVAIVIGTVALIGPTGSEPTPMVRNERPLAPIEQETPAARATPEELDLEPAGSTVPVTPITASPDKEKLRGNLTAIDADEHTESLAEQAVVPTITRATDQGTPDPGTEAAAVNEGAAIVESIIQDLTSEVKQEVLAQPQDSKDRTELPVADQMEDPVAEPEPAPSPKLFMPNTFTPNGDGVNDEYEVGGLGAYEQVMIRVTSLKTGQIVFRGNGSELWRGDGCEDGMYLVALEARTADGRSAAEGKVVWLNRNPLN